MQSAFAVLLSILILYVGACSLVWALQDRFVYFPERNLVATPAAMGLDFEDVSMLVPGGEQIHGWYIPAPEGGSVSRAILFCHGNGGNISHRIETIALLHSLGAAVLIFDYRGYGMSDGSPGETSTYEDAQAAWDFLKSRHFADEEVYIQGRSLGGAIASHLALNTSPGGLIIESSFSSAVDVGASAYWFLPVRWLMRHRYDSAANVAATRCRKLLLHSRSDDVVPFRFGEALYQAAAEPKRFVEISGDHNTGFLTTGERYREEIARFIAQ